jgi:hypothetical protein
MVPYQKQKTIYIQTILAKENREHEDQQNKNRNLQRSVRLKEIESLHRQNMTSIQHTQRYRWHKQALLWKKRKR